MRDVLNDAYVGFALIYLNILYKNYMLLVPIGIDSTYRGNLNTS